MTIKATTVRVAVVQAGAVPFDSDACVDKAVRLIEDAAASGAKVIVFPEASFLGIPRASIMVSWLTRAIQPVVKSSGSISTRPSTCPVRRRIDLAKSQRPMVVTS